MDKSNANRSAGLNVITNQPTRTTSKSTDPLAKIRPLMSKKPQLVPTYSRANPTQITSGLKMLSTRIQSNDAPSYQPLVTISDNENSELVSSIKPITDNHNSSPEKYLQTLIAEEENFVAPIQKLTKEELREELKVFNQASQAALLTNDDNDDETGDLQFRVQQPIRRSICCYQYPCSLKDSSCTIS